MTRDIRKYIRGTNIRLIAGFAALLFIVGDGLIWILYGRQAAMMGLLCLVSGLAPILLIVIVMVIINWIVGRAGS